MAEEPQKESFESLTLKIPVALMGRVQEVAEKSGLNVNQVGIVALENMLEYDPLRELRRQYKVLLEDGDWGNRVAYLRVKIAKAIMETLNQAPELDSAEVAGVLGYLCLRFQQAAIARQEIVNIASPLPTCLQESGGGGAEA